MSTEIRTDPRRPRGFAVTEGDDRAPARAMLRAVGMGDADLAKPQVAIASTWSVAIASTWSEVTPCNLTLRDVAAEAEGRRRP
jgi:dihydroxy-acid dehydratase